MLYDGLVADPSPGGVDQSLENKGFLVKSFEGGVESKVNGLKDILGSRSDCLKAELKVSDRVGG